MIPLGGFLDAGGVGLWGILAPLAALVFSDVRSAARWYVAYVVVFLGSGIAGELLGGVSPAVPGGSRARCSRSTSTVGGTIVFTLLAVFAAPAPRRASRRCEWSRRRPRACCSTSCRGRSPTAQGRDADDRGPVQLGVDPVRRRRRLHPARRSASRRPRSSPCWITCSATSMSLPSATGSRRSRRSATATWSPRAFPHLGPTMPECSP